MKEFTSQTGGRHTYIDDILNLQDLALAFSSVFSECENFIISGCQVSGTTISSGYVYINGKIRYCAGTNAATKWPMYIYESNYTEKVSYADSNDKVGRNVYSCSVAPSVPTTNDALTGAKPQAINIASDGTALRLKEALFGKYALMIDSPYASQTVKNSVVVEGNVSSNKGLTAKTGYTLNTGTASATIMYDASGNLTFQSSLTGKSALKMVMSEAGAFQFYKGTTLLLSIDGSGTVIKVSSSFPSVSGGNITVKDNHIYNTGVALDRGAININMLGYNGSNAYFRNTIIGNGKNEAIVTFNGTGKTSTFSGQIFISGALQEPFTLKYSALAKTDKTILSYITWIDKNDETMAQLGFVNNANYDYYIQNKIGSVRITSDTYITGTLYVNGVDVMTTLVGNESFNKAMEKKANATDVYTKTESDKKYIKNTDSIDVFVTQAGGGDEGKASVRTAIGAASAETLKGAVMKDQLFADIVSEGLPAETNAEYATKLVERQKALCTAIGTLYYGDSDKRYIKRTDSIQVFVDQAGGGEDGKASVRNAIGAVSTSSFSDSVLKSKLFSDIVAEGLPSAADPTYHSKLETRKRSLCEAIGAAYKDDVASAAKDTGWIAMDVQNCGITTKIYVRQVGAVVSIQGELHTHHSGTIFTLPNTIDPPKYKIGYSHNKYGTWHCIIDGGSRNCVVDECNSGCSEYIGFLITYIV